MWRSAEINIPFFKHASSRVATRIYMISKTSMVGSNRPNRIWNEEKAIRPRLHLLDNKATSGGKQCLFEHPVVLLRSRDFYAPSLAGPTTAQRSYIDIQITDRQDIDIQIVDTKIRHPICRQKNIDFQFVDKKILKYWQHLLTYQT
jgi:hypothetical protein